MTITEIDEKFMREALAEACAAAEVGEVPIGAVVVRDGEIVARAHNRRELDQDPSAHAEFSALCAAAQSLGGAGSQSRPQSPRERVQGRQS